MRKLIYLAGSISVILMSGCTQSVQAPVTTPQPVVIGPSHYINYIVQPGDTLSAVANQYQINYIALARLNGIEPPYNIYTGEILQVPNPQIIADQVAEQEQAYGGQIKPVKIQSVIPAQNINLTPPAPPVSTQGTAASGATTKTIYVEPQSLQASPVTTGNTGARAIANQLISQNNAKSTASTASTNAASVQNVSVKGQRVVAQITWSWPVSGQLIQLFGQGSGQLAKGVQIATAPNAKILASADGTVIYSGIGSADYGKMIIIKQDGNFLTAYTHLSQLLVKQGQNVSRGDPIGVVGEINGSPVLHFEVRNFGNPVNPINYMPS